MNCAEVRELLTDLALGTLSEDQRHGVHRHLRWCAGCRKEAAELAEGAALVGHALPPAQPPPTLGERVVLAVRSAAGRPPRRSRRPFVAALIAAILAVGAFGWALAMTEKAQQLEAVADSAAERARRFQTVVAELLRDAGEGRVRSADLEPIGTQGGGRAVVFDSPGGFDWALIIAGGLAESEGPYRAYLHGGGRRKVGRLSPASAGELAAYRYFARDISEARRVIVRDGEGRLVLRGSLRAD